MESLLGVRSVNYLKITVGENLSMSLHAFTRKESMRTFCSNTQAARIDSKSSIISHYNYHYVPRAFLYHSLASLPSWQRQISKPFAGVHLIWILHLPCYWRSYSLNYGPHSSTWQTWKQGPLIPYFYTQQSVSSLDALHFSNLTFCNAHMQKPYCSLIGSDFHKVGRTIAKFPTNSWLAISFI